MQRSRNGEPGEGRDRRRSSGTFARRAAPVGMGGTALLAVLAFAYLHSFHSFNIHSFLPTHAIAIRSAGGDVVARVEEAPAESREVQFVNFVVDTAQSEWSTIVPSVYHKSWQDAKLVVFRGATTTGCGGAGPITGPFYCPSNEQVYIDLAFYDELRQRFGAAGDLAQAYVIAHEVGHHVQHILGADTIVYRAAQEHPDRANLLAAALELQADCYAGVWMHHMQDDGTLTDKEIQAALSAAAVVGAERAQKAGGHADTFTYGSADERWVWFYKGFAAGSPDQCGGQ